MASDCRSGSRGQLLDLLPDCWRDSHRFVTFVFFFLFGSSFLLFGFSLIKGVTNSCRSTAVSKAAFRDPHWMTGTFWANINITPPPHHSRVWSFLTSCLEVLPSDPCLRHFPGGKVPVRGERPDSSQFKQLRVYSARATQVAGVPHKLLLFVF